MASVWRKIARPILQVDMKQSQTLSTREKKTLVIQEIEGVHPGPISRRKGKERED